jgi:REP element-mobilizing transposase RayT
MRYAHHAWVIMPNHIHLLITPQAPIPQITKSVKNCTALHGNRILNRTGRFWQEESFDRSVRNQVEFRRITAYIENNPVKAGLVASIEEYPWCGNGA